MKREDILKYLDSLHSKISRSSFAEIVTENEIMALLECKELLNPKKVDKFYRYSCLLCPNCKNIIEFDERKIYCPRCGQHLNLERDDE